MAANADAAVRRAALLSDGWAINPHGDFDTIRRQLNLFRTTRADAGLPPAETIGLGREIFCAPTRHEALAIARPYLGDKYDTYAEWGQDKALPGDESFCIPFETLAAERFIIGTPDDCTAMLHRWQHELGITDFVLRTNWFGMPYDTAHRSLRLIADHVIPNLTKAPTP